MKLKELAVCVAQITFSKPHFNNGIHKFSTEETFQIFKQLFHFFLTICLIVPQT